jgi:OmpA-OmpF porin, OOP family
MIFDLNWKVVSLAGSMCLFALSGQAQQQEEKMSRLLEPVNSSYHEEAPVLSPDGRTLYFSRAKHSQNIGGQKDEGDIWYATLDENGNWTEPQHMGKVVNDKNYNAVIGIDQAGSLYTLSFDRDRRRHAREAGVFRLHKSGEGWDEPEALQIRDFMNRSEHQSMSLSANGRVLMMSIDSYGSYGNEDIYVSFRQADGSWSAPRNLGADINTYYQEMTPFLAPDNKTLFFATNGRQGEGSRDLFVSQRLDDSWRSWSEPVNLTDLVNTPGVELFYSMALTGDYDLYVSTQNSQGFGDIHIVEAREKIQQLPVIAKDTTEQELPTSEIGGVVVPDTIVSRPQIEKTEDQLVVSGKVLDQSSGEKVPAAILNYQLTNGDTATIESIAVNGEYQTKLKAGNAYTVTVKAKGYMTVKKEFTFSPDLRDTILMKNYELVPLKVGTTIQLESVKFKKGTAEMFEDSYDEINRVVQLMQDNPDMVIELSGHTDNQGNFRQNMKLSEERVETVKEYMTEMGVSGKRIKGKGYGASRPIASNLNEEGRRKNRRVEFKILKLN